MTECWQELAAAASREKDSEKLRLLIARLIDTLGHEQKRLRGEIEKRLAHSAEATDARFRPFHPVALLEYTQRLLRHKTSLLRSAGDDGRLFPYSGVSSIGCIRLAFRLHGSSVLIRLTMPGREWPA
jgi:hypothetical protein